MTTLVHALRAVRERWPDRTAIVALDGALTYRELARRADRLAVALGVLGVEPADRVLCSVSDRTDGLIVAAATWERGAVHARADHAASARELETVLARAGARALVYEPPRDASDPLAVPRALRALRPGLVVVLAGDCPRAAGMPHIGSLTAGEGEAVRDGTPGPADAALAFFAPDANGTPVLAVERHHGDLAEHCRRLAVRLNPGGKDVHLAPLLLSHATALTLAFTALISGGTLVVRPRIVRGGIEVDPVALEAALAHARGVADAAVIGRPDPTLGERICACVVTTGEEPQPRLGALREMLGRSLPPSKLPDELRTLRAIPRTPLGTVDGARLRALLETTPHLVERRDGATCVGSPSVTRGRAHLSGRGRTEYALRER